jgi:hypothetical protein
MLKKFLKWIIPGWIIQKYKPSNPEKVFTSIYRHNAWEGEESVSGPGSSLQGTAIVREQLPALFRKYHVKTLLDIPCGDFNWFKAVDLHGIHYTGADIVKELISQNNSKYKTSDCEFKAVNLMSDPLPESDMIFCRDCLVHLSNRDIKKALKNIIKSRSKYLVTTSFTSRKNNVDINTGGWRPLNLQIAPFNLPAPLEIINEECKADNGAYADKSLCLWEIAKLNHVELKGHNTPF